MLFFVYILLILFKIISIIHNSVYEGCILFCHVILALGSWISWASWEARHPSLYGVQSKLKEHDLQIWRPNLMGRIGQI